MSTTTNYSFAISTIGGDNNSWGQDILDAWERLDSILFGDLASIQPNLTLGAWEVDGVAVTASAAELNLLDGRSGTLVDTVGYPAVSQLVSLTGNILTDAQSDTLTKGFAQQTYDAGTQSGGSFQPDVTNGNKQKVTNGGFTTLSPPAVDCQITLLITNNGSAGLPTTAGFDIVTGDSLTATDTHRFKCYIDVTDGLADLNVVAAQ